MQTRKTLVLGLLSIGIMLILSCTKNEVFSPSFFDCNFTFQDTSQVHPKATTYQALLEKHRKNGLVGAVLLIKDKDGLWIGADGKADIASDINMQACNTFLIASISKVFTSAAIYRYIDKGILSLDDPISKWIDQAIVDKVSNADEAEIKHLLAHTSGIPDYYTFQLELDRINKEANNWTKEEVLEYTYGVKATNEVGETYYYCNTNFLLLAMILESASGLSFEQVYQQEVFQPLGLTSAYYGEEKPIPDGCVKGYVDVYGNGQYVESEFLYKDELGIGGDGGIAINAYDLAIFFEDLMKGKLITPSSLEAMTNWFDLPEDWHWMTFGQTENGFGIEKYNTDYGYAVGHSGGIDGFSTIALYFPEADMSYVLLVNSAGNNIAQRDLFLEMMELMFN